MQRTHPVQTNGPVRRRTLLWGLLALAFYLVHAGTHLRHHQPENIVWSCHVATVLVGFGFVFGSATLNAIGFLWLLIGNAAWLIDLYNGAALIPTSLLPHVGGFILSIVGLKRFGMPRHVWWKAIVGLFLLQQFSRLVTPMAANVNIAFGVWAGWETMFPSYLWFEVITFGTMLAIFLVTETVVRRIAGGPHETGA
ncbi:MAG: hypothetical protein H6Q33_2281 [Deltaproteobacteria bacterium]|nr:hypothetical protein [Deltaproteobacteria bacterium]